MKRDSNRKGGRGQPVRRFLFPGLLLIVVTCQVACKENKEISAKKLELEQLKGKEQQLRMEAGTLSAEKSTISAKIDDLGQVEQKQRLKEEDLEIIEGYVAEINKAIAHYENEIDIWRKVHRSSLVGLKAASLKTKNGREFPNVTVREVTDDELVIDSDGREVRLQMSELPDQIKTRFVHEESLKLAR